MREGSEVLVKRHSHARPVKLNSGEGISKGGLHCAYGYLDDMPTKPLSNSD